MYLNLILIFLHTYIHVTLYEKYELKFTKNHKDFHQGGHSM